MSPFIARRYLFSRKKQNAINIISAISVVGVAVGTAALVVILSVFNGIDLFLQKSTAGLTPDVVIRPAEGKYMPTDTVLYHRISALPGVAGCNPVVEEKALLKYGESLCPVVVKGVTDRFESTSGIGANITDGVYRLKKGDLYEAVVGAGVAMEVGLHLQFLTPMIFYYPDRRATSMQSALNTESLFPSGIFSSQQETDGKYVITSIDFTRRLFMLGDEVSVVELKLADEGAIKSVRARVQEMAGDQCQVVDKYELNRSFYAMMRSEKLVVFLVLLFILLIASFNIVGSISMLILDKREDLMAYRAMGMSGRRIVSVFRTEGMLITIAGAVLGAVVGVAVCLLQERYGFVKLSEGNYLLDAYPVKLVFSDLVLILGTVLIIGYAASCAPTKYLVGKLLK